MNEQRAVIIGASGLVGTHLTEQLLKDDDFISISILVRKKTGYIHKKLQEEIVNFDDLNDLLNKFGKGDTIFSCIGTTQKTVQGNKELYEKIDHDIPVNVARIGLQKSFRQFLMVSSVGANEKASNFYLRLKGKTESSVKHFAFESISFFRPSMLLGNRKELRPFESALQGSMKFLSGFLFGSLKKYHSINAKDVAKSMITQSKLNKPGIHILEYKEMMELIRN